MNTSNGRRARIATVMSCAFLFLLLSLTPLVACTASKASQDVSPPQPEQEEIPPLNPLTGEEVSSWDLITRRPLAVKVENDPRSRPQSGIVDADLVFEELVEGGITRFICVYLSKDPQVIGPSRSARPSDVDICFYLNPLLACSGGEKRVVSMIRASGIMYIEEDKVHFYRDRSRRSPHNLYTSSALLRQYLVEVGDSYNALPPRGFTFIDDSEDKGESQSEADGYDAESDSIGETTVWSPATSIDIPYKMRVCAASYQYDPASDTYLHSINGVAHNDLTTGKRVAPRNVIVQVVRLTGSGIRDVTGAETPVSQVVGSGRCLIFTGGRVCHATWNKDSRSSPTQLLNPNGDPVPLRPGQTWIHLVSEDIEAIYK
jgi:hypothetical protein